VTAQMPHQFSELVETLVREHILLHKLTESRPGGIRSLLKRLKPELQVPMSSVEEFSDPPLRILKCQSTQSGKADNYGK
jgi:hypothetical protein